MNQWTTNFPCTSLLSGFVRKIRALELSRQKIDKLFSGTEGQRNVRNWRRKLVKTLTDIWKRALGGVRGMFLCDLRFDKKNLRFWWLYFYWFTETSAAFFIERVNILVGGHQWWGWGEVRSSVMNYHQSHARNVGFRGSRSCVQMPWELRMWRPFTDSPRTLECRSIRGFT